jgi:hypothetical protein
MPRKLNLSGAKSAAVESIFYHFADVSRPLESKAPEEFSLFMDEFVRKVDKASRARCPKNYSINNGHYVQLSSDQIDSAENNRLYEKKQTR